MKIALTVWDGWLSPVFDVSRVAVVIEICDGNIVSTTKVDLASATPLPKIERLVAIGVETLICGAISEAVHADSTSRGLNVIGFVAGEVDEVVQAFLRGGLPNQDLSMPGCSCRKRDFRNRQKRRR